MNIDHVVITNGKSADVVDTHGKNWCGSGNDDDDIKMIQDLASGTKLPRLQVNSLNKRKINTPGR